MESSQNSKYVKVAKKPKLSKKNIAKRMEFSKKYQTWGKEWQKVIFSDEIKFNLDRPDGLHYHWHDLRTAPEILSKRYRDGQSVIMWAAFAGN